MIAGALETHERDRYRLRSPERGPNFLGLPCFDRVELSPRSLMWVCTIFTALPAFGSSVSLAVEPEPGHLARLVEAEGLRRLNREWAANSNEMHGHLDPRFYGKVAVK